MSEGKPVWLSDEVLEWIDQESRDHESPNAYLMRHKEGAESSGNEFSEEEIREMAREESEDKFYELANNM